MKNKNSAFTLLEILLVVGIIAILAGIVIIAINPGKQLASVRNTQRLSDLKQLNNAITQFYIDKGTYPASTTLSTTTLTEICNTGSVSATTTSVTGNPCGTLTNLSELVPTYIVAIPVDPSGASSTLSFIPTAYANVNGTGYKIMRTPANQIVEQAPLSELNVQVAIGNIPASGCVATGGTISTTTGYKIHTFTSSGTFTVNSGSCNVEVLVVAGGGGGPSSTYYSGGGGGGGVLIASNYTVSSGNTSVTVGNGGSPGLVGDNSLFGLLTAYGGGSGGRMRNVGGNGGSGGGGGGGYEGDLFVGGLGTQTSSTSNIIAYGNKGGKGSATNGGGGGGAGSAGQDTIDYSGGGNGGSGIEWPIGSGNFYAGGAGGSVYSGQIPGVGMHGGGNGTTSIGGNGNSGTPNTGGGGGGSNGIGGNGGSGIVIVRYAN